MDVEVFKKLITLETLSNKPKIIIDLDRMKYPHTGMHNYCESLYLYFQGDKDLETFFYAHPETKILGNKIELKPIDRFFLSSPKGFDLWHTTNQLGTRIPNKPIKLILTIHDLNFLYGNKPQWKKDRELKRIQKKIDRADYITCISKFTLNDVKKHLNLRAKPTEVIFNGVTVQEFPKFDNPKVKPTRPFLFSLGVIAQKKNLHVLIPMMQHLDLDVVIAGKEIDTNYKHELITLNRELRLTDKIHFVGEISKEEKYWYLNNSQGFVFPSISEGFGIPPIEAMRLGKPVFLSNVTSLPEIGGEVAYYFENFEAEAMAETIKSGLLDFQTNEKSQLSIDWSNQFTWEKSGAKYKEVYLKVIENSNLS